MSEKERHEDDLSSKFSFVGWLLIFAIAVLSAALLLKQYNYF